MSPRTAREIAGAGLYDFRRYVPHFLDLPASTPVAKEWYLTPARRQGSSPRTRGPTSPIFLPPSVAKLRSAAIALERRRLRRTGRREAVAHSSIRTFGGKLPSIAPY